MAHLKFNFIWMRYEIHAPAVLPLIKDPPVPLNRELTGRQVGLDVSEKR
jgi:hypothetical protein